MSMDKGIITVVAQALVTAVLHLHQ
jgi:hypothetical protein